MGAKVPNECDQLTCSVAETSAKLKKGSNPFFSEALLKKE